MDSTGELEPVEIREYEGKKLSSVDDLSQFLGERALIPRCLQRASDREKVRRLVFGEDNPASS